jgi:maltose alpha-D-glucosyltransferase/alpha-amylase
VELGRFEPPFSPEAVRAVVECIPHDWLRGRRWFAEKSRRIERLSLRDQAAVSDRPRAVVALLDVHYHDAGEPCTYVLPLLFSVDGAVTEALEDADYQRLLFESIAGGLEQGPLKFEPFVELPSEPAEPRLLGGEQSNASIAYGREWILKNFRKLISGPNRDLEVGRFLTSEVRFPHTPQVVGTITYAGQATLGVLQRFVANSGDGWEYVLSQLRLLEDEAPNAPDDVYWAQDGLPDRAEILLQDVERLGRITGEMHASLSSRSDVALFAPEPCTSDDVRQWLADLDMQRSRAMASVNSVRPEDRELVEKALSGGSRNFEVVPGSTNKIQIHGDYHLGQVLKTAEAFAIIDFEGEPARSLEERRAKQPALRDVAGMLRSLDYAGWTAILGGSGEWSRRAGRRFVAGWRATSGQGFDERLLLLFQLTKAYYELNYELNNRPDWASVPARGVLRLLEELGR